MPLETSDVGKYMDTHLPQEIRLREESLRNLNKALKFTGMRRVTRCHSLYSVWRRFDGDAKAFVGAYEKVIKASGDNPCGGLYAAWGRQKNLKVFLEELKLVIKASGKNPCNGLYAAWGRHKDGDLDTFCDSVGLVALAARGSQSNQLYSAWGWRQKNKASAEVFAGEVHKIFKAANAVHGVLFTRWKTSQLGCDEFCGKISLVRDATRLNTRIIFTSELCPKRK